MESNLLQNYLDSIRDRFRSYERLGAATMAQLSDQELHWQPNEWTNSISIIVKHLHGNMLSRFTDFLTADGEKDWRDRDGEFVDSITDRQALLKLWEEGWACTFAAVDPLEVKDLQTTVYIRNEGHTIIEALNRQATHYASHIGQMMHIGKSLKGEQWKSLSIPLGESKSFNQKMFAKQKKRKDFS